MHFRKAISACAVSALAMVFSVQQGEHGPLVVYKLEVPRTAAPRPAPSAAAAPKVLPAPAQPGAQAPGTTWPTGTLGTVVMPASPKAAPTPAPAPTARRLSPLEPTVLGTVVLPAERAAAIMAPAEPAAPAPVPLSVPDVETVYRIVSDYQGREEVTVNVETGETLTLQDVNEAALWRRDTAEKLRRLPVGPRF